jgi:hypothetical protein
MGNLYVAGATYGNLGGQNAGGSDMFLTKFGVSGNQQWMSQFGSSSGDRSLGISADGLGNVFHTGISSGGFVSKHDSDGNELWRRASASIGGDGVAADGSGNVFVSGTVGNASTNDDGLVEKFDAAGNQLWSRQFGTNEYDQSFRVSADRAGNVFTFGNSVVSGSKVRGILTKLDSEGNEYWSQLLESARVVRRGSVVTDGLGNVYISGSSNAPIVEPRVHAGYDAFLAKYDAQGNRIWINEFGTTQSEHAGGVAFDGLGNVYVAGVTGGDLGGQNAGEGDAFLAKFDAIGNQLWIHQFGTVAREESVDHVVADGFGNVYVAGSTWGDLAATYSGGGGSDVFIAKFSDSVPEPAGMLLLTAAAAISTFRRARR